MTDTGTRIAAGTPVWVDLGSPDPEAAGRFYGQLFGWQAQDLGEEAGHYTMFSQDGKRVAAVGPLQMPGQPTVWSTYIKTDDAEATTKKVTEAGGTVISPPLQVMEEGTMAVLADPTGAVFSIWQPNKMQGADLFNKPVSLGWNELATRDMAAAKAFYTRVFPWTAKDSDMPGGMSYTEWQIDGSSIGGGMTMGSMYPPGVPSHWLVYFVVADADAVVKKTEELGGKVLSPASDIPQGRMAVLSDPQGANFAIIKLSF